VCSLALCLALPASANTALPISGLPELLAAALLLPSLLLVALAVTFNPALAPSTKAGRSAALAVATVAVVLFSWLTLRLTVQELRLESAREYWVAGFYLAPLCLAIAAWFAVFVGSSGHRSRTRLWWAWLGPPLCWLGLEIVLFVAGTLPAHLS
jgi:hypothetical protein